MDLVWNVGGVLNVVSGLLVAALGGVVLLANPRKDWNRVFALLAIFWGAQIVCFNVVRLTSSEATVRFARDVGLAFLVPVYFFAVVFASVFPRPRPPFGTSAVGIAALALPAAATLVALFTAPRLLVASVEPQGDAFTLLWGPLAPYLLWAPFHGAFFYALHVMSVRRAEAESAIERRQITFVLAAFALYVGYNTPPNLVAFGRAALGRGVVNEAARAEAAVIALIMLAGAIVLVAVARRLLLEARAASAPSGAREARLALAALGIASGAGTVVAGMESAGGALAVWTLNYDLVGLFRFGSVALIVYAIARYQLFDLDLRVKQGAAFGAAALAGVALAAAAWIALSRVRAPLPVGGALATIVAVAAFVPLFRASYRLADRLAPQVSRDGDHLYLRKLEVYRAAVEGVLVDGRDAGADDPTLAEVRTKLGLTERDHGVVVSLASTRAEPARAAPDLRPGVVAFGKYVIESVIAEGGFGRVFLARDRLLNRRVVVKELLAKWRGNESVVRTFLREAQIAGQLNHPNIVAILDVEERGHDYYVIMEHVPGGTLADRLAGGATLSEADAVRIARDVLAALEAAHARGVVHRDVKPANVLVGARGEAKLADFGIADLREEDADRTISGLTTMGGVEPARQPGTLQFMSPEQASGLAVDARSDVYAVGALLYRMLTGLSHVDVAGLDEVSARAAVAAADAPPPVPGASARVNAAIARALSREREKRFGSAREFAESLAERRVERVG